MVGLKDLLKKHCKNQFYDWFRGLIAHQEDSVTLAPQYIFQYAYIMSSRSRQIFISMLQTYNNRRQNKKSGHQTERKKRKKNNTNNNSCNIRKP